MAVGRFPFGQPVRRVIQADRTPKRVFVLGVYASAVHARWCDVRGRQLVKALGVASEPHLFWRGDGVKDILAVIDVPPTAGWLEPAPRDLNGPSGRSIDEDNIDPGNAARYMLKVANGDISEETFAGWLRSLSLGKGTTRC